MKQALVILLAVIMLFGLCACQRKNEKPIPLNKYNLDTYMLPYWQGNAVYHESVMLLENKDGSVPDIPLLYKPVKILSVRSSDLQTVYEEGKDYVLIDGKLHIPEGSAIPTVTYDFYYPTEKTDNSFPLNSSYGEGYIFFSEGSPMHSMQIAVSYTHEETFSGQIPTNKSDRLPKTITKLNNHENLNICILGDSISTGANSSGMILAEPMAETWFQMVVDMLEVKYPDSNISLFNPSVGGKTSVWGVEEASKITYGPDLCIIGFGMNDGSNGIPPEDYQKNIKTIMETIRASNPDCEFVLLATMLPNREVWNFWGNQAEYLPVLLELETEGVVVADITTYHQHLLTVKRYYDMSGNNVNHANDFLARAYAHVVWQTMIGY